MIRVPCENDLLECPYEKTHRILRCRMQVHLVRCRKAHPHIKKVRCPFNSTHLLNEPELKLHVQDCPERKLFETFRRVEKPVVDVEAMALEEEKWECVGAKGLPMPKEPIKTVPPVFEPIVCEENWDDEPDVPAYDPTAAVLNKNVLRLKQGAPASEKKKFRQMERLRLMELQKQQSGGMPQQSGGVPPQSAGMPQQSGGMPQHAAGIPQQSAGMPQK